MRKIIAALMALTMAAAITSCGADKKADSSSAPEETTTAETTTEAGSEEETTAVTTPAINPEDLTFDFTGLASEKYINILSTSDKYHLKYNMQDGQLISETYIDGENIFAKQITESLPFTISMLSKDGNLSMICDEYKAYCTSTNDAVTETLTQFKNLGLVGSGETEVDGVKYKYDEFTKKDDTSDTIKLLIDDKGELFAFENNSIIIYIDEISEEFDSDKIFNIPSDYKEMSEDELYAQLTAAMQEAYSQETGSETGDSAADDSADQTTTSAN
ncbi:MAG: hypothetical protein Q4F95_03075 [Oscillospiraceae bacterium]|nr:hypothetical protein [Oscillospiraceae bacterium]